MSAAADPEPHHERLDRSRRSRTAPSSSVGHVEQREVHVVAQPGAHRRRADRLRAVRELRRARARRPGRRRSARAPSTLGLSRRSTSSSAEVGERVARERAPSARASSANSRWWLYDGARGERDRDHHDAEVHDHAAVGPADEPAPALAPRGEHELAERRAGGEPAEPERDAAARSPRAPSATASTTAPTPIHAGHSSRCAAARRDALRHGSTGATAMRNSSARPIGIVMRSKYGAPTEMLLAVERLDDQREHRAEQHDERERGEQQVVGEERALARDRRVDAARASAAGRPASRSARPVDQRRSAEEREQPRADVATR